MHIERAYILSTKYDHSYIHNCFYLPAKQNEQQRTRTKRCWISTLRKAILAHPRNSIQQKSEFDLKILHGYREIHEDPIYN